MNYPGFVPFVCNNNIAYIFRDGFLYNVNNTDLRLKTGDWVNGNFDRENGACHDIEKTAGPLKTILSDDAFYFIGGYCIGTEYVKPFGKVDTTNVPAYYKPNEFVTAMFKLVMTNSCTVSVDEILFAHSKGTFIRSCAIPVDGQYEEDNQEDEKDQEETRDDTNDHQQDKTSDPKILGDNDNNNDSDSDISVNFDPIAAFRRPKPLPSVMPEEEKPPAPLPKDYPGASKTSDEPNLPFYYGKNAVDPSETKSQLAPVRKDMSLISFSPSPSSTPLPPVKSSREAATAENLNKSIFLIQKQDHIPISESSSPGFSTDSDGFNSGSGYPRPFSPKYSDVEDEFSDDEDGEYDLNPDEDEEAPFRTNAFDFDVIEGDQYNIDAHVYDTENSDNSSSSFNNSLENSDSPVYTFHGPAEHKPNTIGNPIEETSPQISSVETTSSDGSLNFVKQVPKEYMNDINAWKHAYSGEKFTVYKQVGNRHILFAKFANFAMLYDTDSIRDNFGVIFRDDNLKYYDSLVVGGVYKGTRAEIFDNTSKNGMPDLAYYLIRPEQYTTCDVNDSVISVSITNKKRRSIKSKWSFHDFTILDVENFGTVGFPTKYVPLLKPDVLIKGTARFYVHPKITCYWGFVGEFTFYTSESGQKFTIDESESFHYYLKTKFASYLQVAGPEYYTPRVEENKNSRGQSLVKKDPNTPYTRRQLEDLIPTFEYVHHPRTMPNLSKWKKSFEFY